MSDLLDGLLTQEITPEDMEASRRNLVDMRRRIAAGEAIPAEELAEGLKKIRVMFGREAQAAFAKKKPAKKKAAPKKAKVDVDALLGGILGDL